MSNMWHWIVNLEPWIDRFCRFETTDGFKREGVISGIDKQVLEIKVSNGKDRTVFLPVAFEMNNDPTDRMEFARIKSFELGDPVAKDERTEKDFLDEMERFGYYATD